MYLFNGSTNLSMKSLPKLALNLYQELDLGKQHEEAILKLHYSFLVFWFVETREQVLG